MIALYVGPFCTWRQLKVTRATTEHMPSFQKPFKLALDSLACGFTICFLCVQTDELHGKRVGVAYQGRAFMLT
eukprot:5342969-Amphidinium_carterae.1